MPSLHLHTLPQDFIEKKDPCACRLAPTLPLFSFSSYAHMKLSCMEEGMPEALHNAHAMYLQGKPLLRNMLYTLLQNCRDKKDISPCRYTHSLMLVCGFFSVAPLADHCIRFFALSSCLFEANLTFVRVSEPSIHTWHALIVAYFKLAALEDALNLYQIMLYDGIQPNNVVFLTLLKECGSRFTLDEGRIFHSHVIECGFQADLAIGSTLIDMYAKCGCLMESQKVFDGVRHRDLVVWNSMISGYAQCDHGLRALELFEKMQKQGIKPTAVTFSSLLRACSTSKDLERGRSIHALISRDQLESNVFVGSALVDMYAKCGSLAEAREVFSNVKHKNVVSWNALLAGYAQQGLGEDALDLFVKMQEIGPKPDRVTYLWLLKACDGQQSFDQIQLIHNQIVEDEFCFEVAVGTALVESYARLGSLEDAHKVFDELPNDNVVTWGALVTSYVSQGLGLPALELYAKMQQGRIKPDKVMLLCVLKACTTARAIIQGKRIHDQVVRANLESDGSFGSALLDMYAKCGSFEEANKVFLRLRLRDLVSWSAMIATYAESGNFVLARQCIEEMQKEGLKPDRGIYTSMLAACSHACKVNEGLAYFKAMKEHGITPDVEHFNSMIVLLSHSGYLNEAGQLTQTMPIFPDTSEWTSLLAACKEHGDMKLANKCFDQVVQSDSNVASGYALMSSMYAESHMWEDANELQGLRTCAGAWKKPGDAWIEVNMQMHGFVVDDESHSESSYITAKLNSLKGSMKMQGYVPQGDISVGSRLIEGQQEVVSNLDAAHEKSDELGVVLGVLDIPHGISCRVTPLAHCLACY